MVIIVVCYIAGVISTFFLICMLRGRNVMASDIDSTSALVGAVAWPFTLMALVGCITLWWLFDVLDLLFYSVVTYFRSNK